MKTFTDQIHEALKAGQPSVHLDHAQVTERGQGELPSCFATSDLSVAALGTAASELAGLTGASDVAVDRRLALIWYGWTLAPQGWEMPEAWDPIAGDYRTADGWIRLHTNAPHHRAAAMSVLKCPETREDVAETVAGWSSDALETAVVAADGAAAAMRSLDAWAVHPQGRAVASEPLIHWRALEPASEPKALPDGLRGLRVLDLTRVLAGPVATRFLAGFGADVLRIDPPGWDEPGVIPEISLGKRRATLDLRQAPDRQRFEELLRQADVVVHGYRPGALEALEFGLEARQRLAPGQIDVSLDAYGWTGPWAGRRGFDSLVQMSCGIAAEGMRRADADRPKPLPVQAIDHGTGYLVAAAVLRALRVAKAGGPRLSARLSLARTAHLLTGAGARDYSGVAIPTAPEDMASEIEQTGWGPAQRVRFPVQLDGQGPRWPHPSGPLHSDPARW